MARYRAELNAISTTEAPFTAAEVYECLTMNYKMTEVLAEKGGQDVALFNNRKSRFGVAPAARDMLDVHKAEAKGTMTLVQATRRVDPHCPKCNHNIYEPWAGERHAGELQTKVMRLTKASEDLQTRCGQLQLDLEAVQRENKMLKKTARDHEEQIAKYQDLISKYGNVTFSKAATMLMGVLKGACWRDCARVIRKWCMRMEETKLKKKIKKGNAFLIFQTFFDGCSSGIEENCSSLPPGNSTTCTK